MDPFTQRILDRAEQRSKHLGISNPTTKVPLGENSAETSLSSLGGSIKSPPVRKSIPVERKGSDGKNVLTYSANTSGGSDGDKFDNISVEINITTDTNVGNSAETSLSSLGGSIKSPPVRKSIPVERKGSDGKNVLTYSANTSGGSDGDKFDNISVEINITTDTNVGVKCDVMAVDVDKDGNILKSNELLNESTTSVIRDASKSRLQRLGALYSDEQSISSPIHRTEGNFHERMSSVAAEPARPRNRLGKLAALAESINRWEDEKQPPQAVGVQKENVPEVMKQTGAVPKRPQVVDTLPKEGTAKKTPTKQLKWDKSVMDALESQGFKRRESTKNLIYEYRETENRERENVLNETNKSSSLKKSKAAAEGNPSGSYVATIEANRNTEVKDSPKKLNVTRGLVTGRAAFFEASGAIPRTQKVTTKDPAEMSLKERMALFERNKGAAPVPKQLGATSAAATATAAAQQAKPEEKQQQPQRPGIGTYNQVSKAETKATGGGIKNTVAALMSSGATISESAISQEVKRQRQQEMELLLNRFHQPQKSDSENEGVSMTDNNPPQPPPPPPMPSTSFGSGGKRRSDGENDHDVTPEEAKRPKKHGNRKSDRLYPSLSDLDSTESEQNCTTASVSDAAICEEDDNAMDSEETEEEDGSSLFDGSISRAVMNSIQMELLLNRFHQPQKSDSENEGVSMTDNNPPQPPPPPPMPSTSFGSGGKRRSDGENDHDVTPEEAKRPKKHGNRKSDRLYPSLSDLDSTESEQNCTTASVSDAAICEEDDNAMDSEETEEEDGSSLFDGSISRAVMNSIRSAETSRIFSETKDVVSSDDDEMDEYLNAALEISSGSSRRNTPKSGGTPRKGSVSSNSFSYKKNSPGKHLRFETPQTPKKSPRKQVNDDEGVVTLVHTVSIYRKQQTTKPSPSKVVRRVEVEESETETSAGEGSESSHTESQEMHKVQEKISRLQDEVRKQQQIIAQTSQVVNLCAATIEFSGSTEAVEGERHLLVATHRRQAALHEIQRLQVERTLRPRGSPQDKGRLTVNEITLPLTKDYIRKLAANTISGHHLVCLLKYNETVLATKTVLTLPGLMAVKFTDVLQMNDVYADFKVTLEIYGMVAERDILPHEIKYHIATRKQGGKMLTPKGRKAESRLVMPPTQSPAGPSAVRSPSLVQLGFVIFALKDTQRTAWTLNGTCKDSPLNGTVQMKVSCQLAVSVNHWGFLTMFDDVSGLGNWYRRWCRLHGHTLSYWTYPDDEKKKDTQRTAWTLNGTCKDSPLNGHSADEGFMPIGRLSESLGLLTMFDDVSGLGNWYRRWCRLHGHTLSYWTYPDDEKKKKKVLT
uniref:Putative actin-binding protein anillin isoform x1 n=1 Tax=Lutzomyia longipalpis TaxID=7200 RepID=A0A7G3AC04_LUTLO